MIHEIYKDAEQRMQRSLQALKEDLAKQRTGRATPAMLDAVTISYYGSNVPLSQVAAVGIEGPLTLTVKPWEKHLVPEIEKAIITADLGLNPSNSGDLIRVPLPPLTEERRKELIKKVKAMVEQAKVAIRNIRRDANNKVKELLKEKSISEDDEKKAQDKMQQLTDKSIKDADAILAQKEVDLMQM